MVNGITEYEFQNNCVDYLIDKTVDGGNGNSTGNGTASSNATVGLTSPPSDISWD